MAEKPEVAAAAAEKTEKADKPAESKDKPAGRGFGAGGKPGFKGPRKPRGEEQWKPVTKLGRLVRQQKITSLEEIFKFAIPIKEAAIVDHFLKSSVEEKTDLQTQTVIKLKEEVMQVKPVQKQTCAGQRTRFKAYAIVGDKEGHIGVGWKSDKEVQGAIKGALTHAKLNLIPVRRGYWGNKIGQVHTVPVKVHGKCGSVSVRLVPAPRGTGLVAAPVSKKVLEFAGLLDCYTSTNGKSRTRSNFVKAVFFALKKTYSFLTPDLWGKPTSEQHPFEQFSSWLQQAKEQEIKDGKERGRGRGGREFKPRGEFRGEGRGRGGRRPQE